MQPPSNITTEEKRRGHIEAFSAAAMWSLAFVCIRRVVGEFMDFGNPPLRSSLDLFQFRTLIATVLFLPHVVIHRKVIRTLNAKEWILVIILGVTSVFGYHISLNFGAQLIPTGYVSLLISMSPIISALLAWFFLGESLHKFRLIAIGLGFIGIGLCLVAQNRIQISTSLNLQGTLLVLFSAFNGAIFALTSRAMRKSIPSTLRLGLGMILCVGVAFPFWEYRMFEQLTQLSPFAIFALLYLSVTMYFGSILWLDALKKLDVLQVTIYLNVSTVMALVWGALIYHEKLTPLYLVGSLLVILAIFVVNREGTGVSWKNSIRN
jgi:drug/metabolite transporter (DMT)-like permease